MSISTRLAPLPDKEARTQSLQVITMMMMIMMIMIMMMMTWLRKVVCQLPESRS